MTSTEDILNVRDRIFQFRMDLLLLFWWKLKYATVKSSEGLSSSTAKNQEMEQLEAELNAHSYLKRANKQPLKSSYSCKEKCLSMAYGSFIRGLERLGLEEYVLGQAPQRAVTRRAWNGNLNDLYQQLGTFFVLTCDGKHSDSCGLADFQKDMKSLARDPGSFLLKSFYVKDERKFGEWGIINTSNTS